MCHRLIKYTEYLVFDHFFAFSYLCKVPLFIEKPQLHIWGDPFPIWCIVLPRLFWWYTARINHSDLYFLQSLPSPFSKTNIADTLQQPHILPTVCYKDLDLKKNQTLPLLILSRSCLQKICATTKCHNSGKLLVLKQAIFQEIASIALPECLKEV